MLCGSLRNRIHTWLSDYDRLQSVVVILIYVQIGCALIGSLGASYNGVLLVNLVITLFGLVAIESNSQSLSRTYAVLLVCAILLDISWFILFSKEIWNISSEMYQAFYIFSVKLSMAMEIAGFVVRLSSSLLWFQIYRLGASIVYTSLPRLADSDQRNSFLEPSLFGRQCSRDPDLRNSFLEPSTIPEHRSRSDEILEDSIDEPAKYPFVETIEIEDRLPFRFPRKKRSNRKKRLCVFPWEQPKKAKCKTDHHARASSSWTTEPTHEWLLELMTLKNGTELRNIIEKELTASDVNGGFNRVSIPFNEIT